MTTAIAEGRRLRLEVDGIEEPFLVDPLPARRGRALTDEFIRAAIGARTIAGSEAIFIESIGPLNYIRISGNYVDEFDTDGVYLRTWTPDGETVREDLVGTEGPIARPDGALDTDGAKFAKFAEREALPGEATIQGEAIRQEEGEQLALSAFYWQTVVGMEAVAAFLGENGGTAGSLKALALLQTRLGLSPTVTSRSRGMESLIAEGASSQTSDTPTSSGSVHLPVPPGDRPAKGSRSDPNQGRRRWGRR